MSFLFNTTVEYVPYHSVQAIDTMRSMPRFSHSSDFSYLLYPNTGKPKDYISGLLFLGIFTMVCFLVWFLLLAVFKFYFKGALSGGRSVNSKQYRILCIAFWIATGISLIFTILFMAEGITDIQHAISTIDGNNHEVSNIITEAESILASLLEVGESSSNIRESLVKKLDNFCPSISDFQFFEGFGIKNQAKKVIALLNKLSDFFMKELQNVQNELGNARAATKDIDSAITSFAIRDWQALLIIIPWIFIPSAMSIGVIKSSRHVTSPRVQKIMMGLFLPLLTFLTILSVALASLISLYAVGNADFCYGGSQDTPNESVFKIVKSLGYSEDDIMYHALDFYSNQCQIPNDSPLSFLELYQEEIQNSNFQLGNFSKSLLMSGLNRLTLPCVQDFQEIAGLVGEMTGNLSLLKQNALDTLELLGCDKIVPLYTSTFFDAICTSSIQGATWAYSALLVMSLMGMVMITCRSAYLDIDDIDDDKVDDEESEKDDHDDERYSDEGDDCVSYGKEYQMSNNNFDLEESSFLPGSYASDDDDLYTSVGNSKADIQYSRDTTIHSPLY